MSTEKRVVRRSVMYHFKKYCMVSGQQTGIWVLMLVVPQALGLRVLKLMMGCFGNPFSGSMKG